MAAPTTHTGNTETVDTGKARINITSGQVHTRDFKHDVALGYVDDATLWNKFGYNSDIDSASGFEIVASFGGSFTPNVTATTLDIVSSSLNDDSGGTGCNSVVIYGVDSNWASAIEVVTLDGTTPVTTTSTWVGINRVAMFLCGTGQTNDGTITITATTGGRTMAAMPAGDGVTQQCLFYVPASTTFVMEYLLLGAARNASNNPFVTFKFWVYSTVSNGIQEVFRKNIDTDISVAEEINPNLPFPVTEKTVLWLEADTDQNDTQVTARFSGVLVDS